MFTRRCGSISRAYRIVAVAGVVTSLGSLTTPLLADAPQVTAAEASTRAFQWFSTLGYPDVKDRPFVRVVKRYEKGTPEQHPTDRIALGFIVDAKGDDFTLSTFDLERTH